jgi:phage major head subunit gpT-like protein
MDPKHVDMSRLDSGAAPVLAAHDQSNLDGVIGVVERAWLDNGVGRALLRFSASDPVADKTFKKIQERILRNVSVGYSVSEYTDTTQKSDKYPTMLATRWQPKEISIVPIGFDAKATTRSAEEEKNEVEIIGRAEGSNMKVEETVIAAPVVEAVVAPAAPVVDTEALTREAAKQATAQERTRVSEIQSAVRAAKLEEVLASDFITRGVSMVDAAKEIFKKLEEQTAQGQQRSNVKVEITRDEKETQAEALENYLANRFSPSNKLDEKGKIFGGMSMTRVAEQLVGRKIGESELALANRAMSTSDLPNILANVAEKSMRAAYVAAPQSFKPFTKAGTLRNYKSANRLQLGDAPALQALNEHGEVVMGNTVESKETIQLKRYLSGISFTKEMIVNDDLSALSGFSAKYAQQAANLESDLVYGILTANAAMGDAIALFHASHTNLAASGSVISVASVGAAWAAMMKQTDLSGNYLNLSPKYLVVPPEIMTAANQFVSTALLATQSSNINPFAGRLTVIADARLSANSATAWYLSAEPSQIDTVELATLEGEQGPLVTVDQNHKTPGTVRIICEHSAGASALDFRGLYKNPGA